MRDRAQVTRLSLRFIIYCARGFIVVTPKIEVESSFLAILFRFIK